MIPAILLVDDDRAARVSCSTFLSLTGFTTIEADSVMDARKTLNARRFDAVLLDLSLPDGNGLDLISEVTEAQPDTPIVVVTRAGDVLLGIEAMRRGADHFMTKPVNMDALEVFLRKSLELGSLRRRNRVHNRIAENQDLFFGESPAMRQTSALLKLAAENDSVVLLQGEPGTGKSIFARWIHNNSPRSTMPFVEVNCSSLKGEVLGKELFGQARNGSDSSHGLLDMVHRGSLFLDEISEMDLGLQSDLLKVLEEKRYRRLGEDQQRTSNFRLVCSTASSLSEAVHDGRLLKDLYLRITAFCIDVPSLRRRSPDLPALVQFLLHTLGFSKLEITEEAMALLKAYSWPGNVREVRNVLERALLLAQGKGPLSVQHFPGIDDGRNGHNHGGETHYIGPRATLEEVREAFHRLNGDKKKMADTLGISRATLYRRLRLLR